MDSLSALQQKALRAFGSVLSPGGVRGSLLILIYHRVLEARDPILAGEPTASEFAAQMDAVRALCNVLPLTEAVRRLRAGTLPPRAASITFDDGYANNREIAAPILKARELPATIFVSTGFIHGGAMWNDIVIESVRCANSRLDLTDFGMGAFEMSDVASRIEALGKILPALKYLQPAERLQKAEDIAARVGARIPRQPMMTERQLQELAAFGIEIGAHTMQHPILKAVEPSVAREEIASSKSILETITGRPVSLFAYPNGRPGRDYDATHVEEVRRCGFTAAVSTAWGAAGPSSDLFQLPRMLPWEQTALRYSLRLLRTWRQQRAEAV